MLTEQVLFQATNVEKAMYRSLTELEDLTRELSQAVSRGDKVSIRMFLSMRRDSLNQIARYQAALRRLYIALPGQDARLLRALVEDASPPACAGGEELGCQAARNRALLSRIMEADKRISQHMAGRSSFYAKRP